MEYSVKGFIEIPSLISNVNGSVASMGELSNHSRTYSIDQLVYDDENKDAANIVVFSSIASDQPATPPSAAIDKLHDLMEKSMNEFVTSKPWIDQAKLAFPDISTFEVGSETLYKGKQLPNWFTCTIPVGTDNINVKFWINDLIFRSEYDLHETLIAVRVNNVSELFSDYATAKAALESVSLSQFIAESEEIRNEKPFTKQEIVELTWQDPADNSKTLKVPFQAMIYGAAGGTYDSITDAIRDFLVKNSNHTLEEWIAYFPELLNVDVFTFIPQWDAVAIGNSVTGDNVYTPTFYYDESMNNVRKVFPNETLTDMKKVTDFTFMGYKSMGLAVVGKDTNSDGKVRWRQAYPNYCVLDANDPNLRRLGALTISAINKLAQLVRLCNDDDGTAKLPAGIARSAQNGFNFIELTENGIIFRMVTKKSYLANI